MATPALDIRVRLSSGSAADLDGVMRVMDSAFGESYGEAWTRSQCAGILPMQGVHLVVARDADNDEIVGFSLSRAVAGDAELLLLAVDPARHRRGIGTLLLEEFLEVSESSGAERIHLEVREGNPAIAMYRTAGFVTAGRRRQYYRGADGQKFDALTLVRQA